MLVLSSLAFFVVVFLLGGIVLAVLWMAFLKSREEETEVAATESEAGDFRPGPGEPSIDFSPLFLPDRLSTITFWDSLLARFDVGEILKTRFEQAELNWSVGRFTSMMLLLGVVVFVIALRFTPVWVAIGLAILAGLGPYRYVVRTRNKRFQKFKEAFPDVLDSLARALRAGYPLSAAMDMIASETLPPVSAEIRRVSAEANLGRGWPQALENLGRRVPLLEVNMFIAAVQLHARTGGKLSEVMTGLAENMRENLALQGEVRALAAHGRLTGLILSLLPIGIGIMMMIVSPDYMHGLLDHPMGKNMIGAAAGCLLLAHFIIGKIVDIKT